MSNLDLPEETGSVVLEDLLGKSTRRDFLKKAGLGAAGIAAVWMLPQMSTVHASAAYQAITGATTLCYSARLVSCDFNSTSNQTTITFEVCNACGKDVSHVSFEELPNHSLVSPTDGSSYVGPKLNATWDVEWTSNPFDSIKFQDPVPDSHGFKNGGCECFTVVYTGEVSDKVIRVIGKHSDDTEEMINVTIPAK